MRPYKILIFDGDHLMHRCLHIASLRKLSFTVNGVKTPTGIVKGVLSSLGSIIVDQEPDLVFFCMTGGACNFRKEIYSGYKKKDKSYLDDFCTPEKGEEFSKKELLETQDSILREILPDLGIRIGSAPGFEADDIGMYLSVLYNSVNSGYQTILITDDWDWAQSVEYGAHLYRPNAYSQGKAPQYITPENFEGITGVNKKLFIFEKALLGDTSDKIPSVVKGMGEATCRKLITGISKIPGLPINVDSIVDNSQGLISDKLYKLLVSNRENFRRNMNLMALNSSVLKNLRPHLDLCMSKEHSFDYNKALGHSRKYGLESVTDLLVSPALTRLK